MYPASLVYPIRSTRSDEDEITRDNNPIEELDEEDGFTRFTKKKSTVFNSPYEVHDAIYNETYEDEDEE
jgi:hypothetical protein